MLYDWTFVLGNESAHMPFKIAVWVLVFMIYRDRFTGEIKLYDQSIYYHILTHYSIDQTCEVLYGVVYLLTSGVIAVNSRALGIS